MSFQQILDIYRKKSWNERNKGERFEMLMKRFYYLILYMQTN